MASDNEKILMKLKNVGNPIFLLRLINSTNKLIANNQMSVKAKDLSRLFVDIGGKGYEYENGTLVRNDFIEEDYAMVKVQKDTINDIARLIGSENDNINILFRDLRRVKNIKKYDKIFQILDNNFETNISLAQFVKFAF